MDSDACQELDPGYIFGHERKSITQFSSKISAKEMLLNNLDTFVVAIVGNVSSEAHYYKQLVNDEDYYISGVIFHLKMLNEFNTTHFGDCIKQPISCTVCMMESYYIDGAEVISSFNKLIDGLDTGTKAVVEQYDQIVLLMTLLQMQENYWNLFVHNLYHKNDVNNVKPDDEFLDEGCCLKIFLNYSEEERIKAYSRMEKVKQYILSNGSCE